LTPENRLRATRLVSLLAVFAGFAVVLIIIVTKSSEGQSEEGALSLPDGVVVEDGDTFVDADGNRVRLLGIDTPEKDHPLYTQAQQRLAELLSGGELRYRYGPRRYDRYGRILALVYADTVLVNSRLLFEGMADAYFFPGDGLDRALLDSLCDAQTTARVAGVGIWSLPAPVPADRYFGNPRSLRFHRPDCSNLRRADTTRYLRLTTREQFLDRCYSPCRNCRP
jgi:endonuclease YncB( thermonuclease family)